MINDIFIILEQIDQDIFQTINMAFLTILIPIAIAIFGDKKEFEELDKNLILDHIVKAKYFLLYMSLVFIPLFFWNISPPWLRLVEMIIWLVGFFFLSKILIKLYHWMKGRKFPLRFDYLKNLNNLDDFEEVWLSVWRTEKINSQNELEFFKIFINTIEKLLKTNDEKHLKTTLKLLNDFDIFMNNRSVNFLIFLDRHIFLKILELHFKIWERSPVFSQKNESHNDDIYYFQILQNIESILKKFEKTGLTKENSYLLFMKFFSSFKKHLKKYEEKISEDKDKYFKYIESLLSLFYQVFFENIEKSKYKDNIWDELFPREWRITKNNLINKNNVVAEISFKEFKKWAELRIRQLTRDFDSELESITPNMFPEVNKILWSRILIFVFSPFGENRIKSVIERKWSFGFITFPGLDEHYKKETFELAILLFPDQFSEENLKSYIKSLEELKYTENSSEEKRLRLLNLFNEMLEYVVNFANS
jgi:hypothetical protein